MTPVMTLLARRRVPLGFVAVTVTLVLAVPTWQTWRSGLLIALIGECFRMWAAGHLEKGREVTRSGPYRLMRHPLYAGSAVIALGIVVAARSVAALVIAVLYMGSTIAAAVRAEEAQMRHAFGSTYDDYQASRAEPMARPFSVARAIRNREHRAIAGLLAGFALLAFKVAALR